MLNNSINKHLPFRDIEKHRNVLRVIYGNPLATRENSDRRPPVLSLVWQQEENLAAKKPAKKPADPNHGWWERFKDTAERIGTLVTIVVVVLSTIGTVMWVTWYVSKYDSRLESLESLENVVRGSGGLTEQVRNLEGSVKRIEAIAETLEKYFLPQILELLRPKAKALLGTPDVGIFNVAHNEVTTDAQFSVPYKGPLQNPSPQKQVFTTYTFEGMKDGFYFLRLQVEEAEGGKIVRTPYDQRVRVGLPTEVGKPDKTCFKAVDNATQIELSTVCITVVLLERVGQDNLIYASAVKTEGTS